MTIPPEIALLQRATIDTAAFDRLWEKEIDA
jgi:hypothetical protein